MRTLLKNNLKNLNNNLYEYFKIPCKLRESYNERERINERRIINEINLYEYFKLPIEKRKDFK